MPGSIPASGDCLHTAQKMSSPPSHWLSSLLASVGRPNQSVAGTARDATTTAAMLKWKPDVSGELACPLSDTNLSEVDVYRAPSSYSWHRDGGRLEKWGSLAVKYIEMSPKHLMTGGRRAFRYGERRGTHNKGLKSQTVMIRWNILYNYNFLIEINTGLVLTTVCKLQTMIKLE